MLDLKVTVLKIIAQSVRFTLRFEYSLTFLVEFLCGEKESLNDVF